MNFSYYLCRDTFNQYLIDHKYKLKQMAINHTESNTWTIEVLVNALSDTPYKKNKITIPKFQRTLVWRKEQKKAFIDSIKKGFPIGAILLYKSNSDADGITYYNLIDGLQRSTSLNQYIKAPTQFFDENNIQPSLIDQLHELIKSRKEIEKEALSKQIVDWITQLKGFEETDGFSSFNLSKHLNESLALGLDIVQITDLTNKFIPFLKEIKDESNINQFSIPVLIYTGNQSNLPIIFERLNSKGTQLSKYQIYAATWTTYSVFAISNRKIIDGIKNKYDKLLEEGYEVENYDSSPKFYTTEFTTFEYLFGFGKFLCDKYEHLFNRGKIEQEDSIGFNIINICLDLPFDEMNKIPEKFSLYNIQDLENCVINSIDFVFNCLKGHISLKMNKRNRIPIVHSELQIVSMIGKAFHSRYDNNLNENSTWEATEKSLQSNLTYHYLYDIVRDHWRGSGDSKAYNLAHSDRYEKPISKSSWQSAFEEWYENDLSKKEKTRANIKDTAILFFKYLYSYSMTAYEELSGIEYDIEHLVPFDKLKDIAGEFGIPISAFPNLCLLENGLNRRKGNLTFYQYYANEVQKGDLTNEQAIIEVENLEKYTHTAEAELQFVIDDFTVENYKTFLRHRFEKITKLFFDCNKII